MARDVSKPSWSSSYPVIFVSGSGHNYIVLSRGVWVVVLFLT